MSTASLLEPVNDPIAPQEEPFHFKTILVPVDFSPSDQCAFRHASELARGVAGQLVLLKIVEVPPAYSFYTPSDLDELAAQAQHKLDEMCAANADYPAEVRTVVRIAVDSVCEEIIHSAKDVKADLIVLSGHDETMLHRIVSGNTVNKLACHSPCPVLVVPCHR
ncbi:MAG: universal stress protein [Limisphaerales bacterium]